MDVSNLQHKERSRNFDASIRARVKWNATTDLTINRKLPLRLDQELDTYNGIKGNSADETNYLTLLEEAKRESTRPKDSGHEFQTRKEQLVLSHPFVNHRSRTLDDGSFTEYHGPLGPTQIDYNATLDPPFRVEGLYGYPQYPDSVINHNGSTLINRAIPTQPHANLAQALAELKDGLPSIPLLAVLKGKGSASRIGADDYLNFQFGISPLISDINKLCEAVKHSNKLVKQFIKDSGKHLRRRRSLPTNDEVLASYTEYDQDSLGLTYSAGSGAQMYFRAQCTAYQGGHSWYTRVDTTLSQQTKWWFSGAFTYFLSEDDSIVGRLERYEQLANHLLGTRISVATLWELAPWSWLIDWYADIGTVLDNATLLQDDGLVLNYGYLMCQTITSRKRVGYGFAFQSGDKIEPHTSTVRTVTKQRWRANPYGFGVKSSEFSDTQWAILAALGMTKGSKILRR